jgi:Flp pilus assembly protein TadD
VVRANPSHVDAHLLLAGLLEQRRQREQAILHLESALRLDPRLHGTRVSLANLYGQTGQLTKAVAYAREAVAAIPKRAEGHVVLGNLYLQQRRTVEALDAFRTALRLRPNLATAHFALGLAHHQRREVALAAAAYRKAMALAPNDWRAHNNLAQLYAEARQNLDEALALATRASEFAPEDPSTLDTLGWVHYVAGAHAKAEPPLRKAVELARSNATFRYHLGMVYYRVGRGDEARSALMQAVLLDPALGDAPDVRAALAKLRE